MKKIMLILATMLLCAFVMSLFSSCNKSMPTTNLTYRFGFEGVSSAMPTSLQEMNTIDNAFKTAFRQELGVSVGESSFTYSGGDAKVKAACEKADQSLQGVKFSNKFTYVVSREEAQGTVVLYTWKN